MSPLSPCIPPSFTRAQAKDAFKKLVPRARVAYAACAACAGPSISFSPDAARPSKAYSFTAMRPPARAPARPRATAGLRLSMLRPPAHHTPPHHHPPTAEDYKATIDGMRAELAQVPFPGKAKIAA